MLLKFISIIQYSTSVFINIASIAVCAIGIYFNYSILAAPFPSLYLGLLLALLFLGYLEGLHFGVVSAQHAPVASRSSYPRAHAIQDMINSESKLVQRFLLGRQFFVILTVFLIAEITTFVSWPVDNFPPGIVFVFRSGLPGIIVTLTFGQLLPQLLCEDNCIQFLDTPGCYSLVYLCLAVERLGISHFSWFLFRLVHLDLCKYLCCLPQKADGTYTNIPDSDSALIYGYRSQKDAQNNSLLVSPIIPSSECVYDEEGVPSLVPLSRLSGWEWLKFIASGTLLALCMAVIVVGISKKYAVLQIAPAAVFALIATALTLLFYLEGLMIAIVSTQKLSLPDGPHETSGARALGRAAAIHELCNSITTDYEGMNNVKRFIMGRQFITVSTVFFISQMTVFNHWSAADFIPGPASRALYFVCTTGLPGALVVLFLSQLFPQLLAAEHPWKFMNLFGSFSVVLASLATEAMGFTHFSRVLFYTIRYFACKTNNHETKITYL